VDIAGLVKGASKGEGLGNKFLANIRETDAILHVLRCFEDGNVVHVDGSVNPIRDKEVIDMELQLKDLESVEARMQKVKKAAGTGDKDAQKLLSLYTRLHEALSSGTSARAVEIDESEVASLNELQLLTAKPVLYVCNVDEGSVVTGNGYVDQVQEMAAAEGAQVMIIGAAIEADIAELENPEERREFLADMGLDEPGVSKLIRAAYSLLNLQTYFTAGVKEVRAWTIKRGFTAPQAAGVIHTDFQKGFIRAEVIAYDDFVGLGSEAAVKEAGRLKVEGKEYLVQDGDVMHFRFNV
jgi:GTP-binding protein YchF